VGEQIFEHLGLGAYHMKIWMKRDKKVKQNIIAKMMDISEKGLRRAIGGTA